MKHNMLHMKLKMAVCSAALLAFLPTSAFGGVCFLPDCAESGVLDGTPEIDINSDSKFCEESGFTYYASAKCPQYQAVTAICDRDDHYLKCDAKTWCQKNGYNTTTCSIPQYVNEACPSYGSLYKGCKTDNAKACKELGYTNTCPSGQKLKKDSGRCSYDSSYGTCCTPSGCPSYASLTSSSYGTNGTDGCGYACYYICNMNCPDGTSTSNPGGCGGSTRNGCNTKTCYYPYVSCCSETCPSSHPYSNCDYGYTSVTENECGTKKCYACRPEPEPVVKKYCSGSMMYEDYNYGGSFVGVIVDGLIVRKDIRYVSRADCVSSCYSSGMAGKSWRITSSRELTKFRCAITALGGPTYDTYWYQEDSKYGQWLLEEDMSGPSSLYSDNDNYCTCVSDL